MALDLNLPPEEGGREAIPDLNGDVDEAQDPGGDGVQRDHVQGGGNPADGVEGDVREGGNPEIQVQPGQDLGGGNQVVHDFDLNDEPEIIEEFEEGMLEHEEQEEANFSVHPFDMIDAPVDINEFEEVWQEGDDQGGGNFNVHPFDMNEVPVDKDQINEGKLHETHSVFTLTTVIKH
ncbi:hypothetical protein SEVIR_9G382701v4 [Setaria viridis]